MHIVNTRTHHQEVTFAGAADFCIINWILIPAQCQDNTDLAVLS